MHKKLGACLVIFLLKYNAISARLSSFIDLMQSMAMIYHPERIKYGKPEYLIEMDTPESMALDGLMIDLPEVWA